MPDKINYVLCQRFRELLSSVNFAPPGIFSALGVRDVSSVSSGDVELLKYRTRRAGPLELLVRLFLMNIPVEAVALKKAIHPFEMEGLLELGLLSISGGLAYPAMKVQPFGDFIFVFDLPSRISSGKGEDYVMGIGSSSITLSNLVVRRHSGLTLDLGTGCGIQGVLAASHSDRVIASDMNPRAVFISALNAALNGITNIETVTGDLFGPVTGRHFDLIISNPPFVISPAKKFIYRDGGMEGDQLCRRIVREAPDLLNEGGFCQILCNWAEYAEKDWREGLREWFEGTGCDAWVLRSETHDAATYASKWIRHTEWDEAASSGGLFSDWMSYYEAQRIASVGAGVIIMRRSGRSRNWFKAEESPPSMLGPCGEHILQGFRTMDFLQSIPDDRGLLEGCFRVSPDLSLEKSMRPQEGGWTELSTGIRLLRGFAYSGNVDSYIAGMLAGCDGSRTVRELAADMSAQIKVDQSKVEEHLCLVVRDLLEKGFLLLPEA